MIKFIILTFVMILSIGRVFSQEELEILQPTSVISITINVVDIILNDEHREGVDWGAIVSDYHTVGFNKEDATDTKNKKYLLSAGTVSHEDYAVLLEALDTVGKVNQHVQRAIPLDEEVKHSFDSPESKVNVQFQVKRDQNNNLILSIEPHFTLPINDSKLSTKTATYLQLKTLLEEKIIPKSTFVLGGIVQEDEITKTHKFPLLGDLPLVGLFFRSHGLMMQKTEKIIFISIDNVNL